MRRWLFFILTTISFNSLAILPNGFDYCSKTIPSLKVDLKYLTKDNFTGHKVPSYHSNKCILTKPSIQALMHVQKELSAFNLGLKVFDAYRPTQAVDDFMTWSKSDDESTKSMHYPTLDKSRLIPLGYIAEKSGHSRGSAIDLTIVGLKTGKALDMGTNFDYFGHKAWPSELSLTTQQRANRLLLKSVMLKYGFKPLKVEWWHFSLRREPFPDTYFNFPVE